MIINSLDNIVKGTKNKLGDTVRYIKNYNNNIVYVVEVVPTNSSSLMIKQCGRSNLLWLMTMSLVQRLKRKVVLFLPHLQTIYHKMIVMLNQIYLLIVWTNAPNSDDWSVFMAGLFLGTN